MAGLTSGPARLESYRKALELAKRPEERWSVFSGVSGVGQVESLKIIEPYLEDVAVKREAFAAYEKIAESLAGRQSSVARESLQRVVEQATDDGLRKRATSALEKLKK